MTGPGATKVILTLCEKVIAQTQPCVRHKQPARYRWLPPRGKAGQCNPLNHAPQALSFGSPLLNGPQKDMPQLPQVAGAFEAK